MSSPEAFGRYQLLKLLARGGMGEVWLARQAGLQGFEKLVVIKRILPHLAEDEDFVHMFLDEGRIAARLNHPNIVQIFDLGQEGEYYFLTMEYAHGEDVRRIWKTAGKAGKPIPPALACRIIADAAAGLDFAHKKSDDQGEPLHIVHRDISPHNILVTFDGGVKVIDFGIARARGRISHTATGALKGRFEYMSPEHAAGLNVDARTDIFALGVVLWETLTGRRLFKRDGDTQTLLAVSDCDVPPPSSLNPDVPPELDAIVLKTLAKVRDDRYRDAAALRIALEDWIVEARKPASSAHLAAFMSELYAERLATEAKLGHPVIEEVTDSRTAKKDDQTKVSQKTDAPASQSAVTGSASLAGPPGEPRVMEGKLSGDAPAAAAATPPPKPASRAPLVAAILVPVVAVAVALFAFRKAPVPTPAPPVAAPAPVAAPPPPVVAAAAAPPASVLKTFVSEPPGADVLVDGLLVGKTPLQWTLPYGDGARIVEFRLAGHKTHAADTTGLASDTLVARLEKVETHAPKAPPKQAPPPSDIKLDR